MTENRPPAPADTVGRQVVDFARRAPSIHNSQPWAWRIGDHRLDLFADRSRQLPVSDPQGRHLVLSCGAALHYAVAGAAALGWTARTELPVTGDDHLATVHLSPHDPPSWDEVAHAELLAARVTDRRRFIGWPVPVSLLEQLGEAGRRGAASTAALSSSIARLRVELLVSRATSVERSDPRFAAEQEEWTEDGVVRTTDGVPRVNASPGADQHLTSAWPSRFDQWHDAPAMWDGRTPVPPTDGLLVVVAERDDPAAWLEAGDVLCRLWVAAMEHGLSLIPSSQVVEVPETRDGLRLGVLGTDAHPMLLVRVGWQELARSPLPPTPRRSLEDILLADAPEVPDRR